MENKIKKLRDGLGISQQELADKMGVDRSLVAMIEGGSRKPSYDFLFKLKKTFDLKNEWLGECICEYVEQKATVSRKNQS